MINIKTFESFTETTNETTGEVYAKPSGRSGLGGETIGTSWSSGGSEESGQVSIPYNPSGANRVFQKVAAPEMGKNHGAHTGKKSREKKLDMKTLKSMFARRQDYTAGEGEVDRPSKVMSFDNFTKDDMNTVKKESFSFMNRENCDRCKQPTNGTTTMSIFNQDVICMNCKELEKKDPDYKAACKAEADAIRNGDYNFKGVYPDYKPLIIK